MRISDWSSDVCSSDLHLTTVLGDHVEKVVHHARIGAVLAYLEVVGRVHVHGHRLHLRAAFRPEQLEARTDFGTGTAAAYPQQPLALHVDHPGRVRSEESGVGTEEGRTSSVRR